MTNYTKTIIATLTYPDYIKYSESTNLNVIATTYFIENGSNHDYAQMNEVLDLLRIKNLSIITVVKKSLGKKILDKQFNGENSIIKNIIVSYDDFFSQEGITKFVVEQDLPIELNNNYNDEGTIDVRSSFIIYRFEETTWFEIKSRFKLFNINISGGSNVKRHLFSPLHLKLAIFILSLEKSNSFQKVIDSFSNVHPQINRGIYDLTKSKEQMEKDIENLQNLINETNNKPVELKKTAKNLKSIQKRQYHTSPSFKNENKLSFHLSSYLNNIHDIINNKELNNKEAQKQIENSWVDIIKELHENPEFITSKYSHTLQNKLISAKNSLNSLYLSGNLKRRFPSIYLYLNKIEIMMITFGIAISGINLELGYTNLCEIIGRKIVYYIYINNYTEIPNSLNNTEKLSFNKFIEFIKLNQIEMIKLGDAILTLLMNDPNDIFERVFDAKEGYLKNEPARLIINGVHLEEIKNNLVIEPASLPMICEPNKWSEEEFGGYLDNELREDGLITGSIYHGHEMFNKDKLYNSINLMSSIKFCINKDLLNYLENEGSYLIEEKGDNTEELQKFTTLQVAKTYENTPFYLPLQADWRGRIYTKPFYITYQGGDLSLALLEFNEGETLTKSGLDSLYIYGANNYNQSNISKDTYPNRIKWVKNNLDNILKMDKDFILKAENKLVFTAFCLVMKQLQIDPNYKVKLSVWLDCTNSGIQHLAAIMKDVQLAKEVNLVAQDDNTKVSDIYNSLRMPINEEIRKYGKDNPKYSNLEFVDLKRKDLKTPIMTKTYAVTQLGIKNQLASNFTKTKAGKSEYYLVSSINKNKTIKLSNKELMKIAQIINNTIFKEYPALNQIYTYFINLAKLMNKLELPIIWLTPTGLELIQKYYTSKRNTIAINFAGKTKKMVIKEWTDKMDKNKQSQGIIANITHSLDSAHLMNVVISAHNLNIKPIITVHDCFGTLPNNLDSLSQLVKLEFIKLYTDSNFLEKFHQRNLQNIEDNGLEILKDNCNEIDYIILKRTKHYIPNLPKLGNLNFNEIEKSKYMIT
jgi:hypothetical protein